jgi:hypothetical protein
LTFEQAQVAGEVINGGSGIDRLSLYGGNNFDFNNATISGVEEVLFETCVYRILDSAVLMVKAAKKRS